jgi:phenylpyruvate tautomerase PptA (4-oxalocrotonate tautomerase family)
MPFLRLQLSKPLASDQQQALLAELSSTVAELLGKPERYMMVAIEPETPMMLGGSGDPAALFELRSVGTISGAQAKAISGAVSGLLEAKVGLDPQRVYANYAGVPGAMWGHGASTFG